MINNILTKCFYKIWPFAIFVPLFNLIPLFFLIYYFPQLNTIIWNWIVARFDNFVILTLQLLPNKTLKHKYEEYILTKLKDLSNTHRMVLISTLSAFLTFFILSKIRIILSKWFLSQHFWINENPKSNPRKIWWYMFWVRVLTAFFEPKNFGEDETDEIINDYLKNIQKDNVDITVTQPDLIKSKDVNGVISNHSDNSNRKDGFCLGMRPKVIDLASWNLLMQSLKSKLLARELDNATRFVQSSIPPKCLYAYQEFLPHLPVPYLHDSIERLLTSLKPLVKFNRFLIPPQYDRRLKEFENSGTGQILQLALLLRSYFITDNYISDWWEKYVYLMNRLPLAINSNYYILDMSYFIPTPKQSARAATIIYQLLKFRQLILNETLKPLKIRETIPVCMNQYRRLFSTCRIPQNNMDVLKHYSPEESKHIIVCYRGFYYKVKVELNDTETSTITTSNRFQHLKYQPFPAFVYQKLIEDIYNADISSENDDIRFSSLLNSLTHCERDHWANVRNKYLISDPTNKISLTDIESAIFMVTIEYDPNIRQTYDRFRAPEKPITISATSGANSKQTIINKRQLSFTQQGFQVLTGFNSSIKNIDGESNTLTGEDRGTSLNSFWFDKSLSVFVFSNGKFGLNCEHSYGDATISGHMHEFVLSNEVKDGSYQVNSGDCIGYSEYVNCINTDCSNQVKSSSQQPNGFCSDVGSTTAQLSASERNWNDTIENSRSFKSYNDRFLSASLPVKALVWNFSDSLFRKELNDAHCKAKMKAQNLDICIMEFNDFGKGFMKQQKISPDAFVQIALQLAYFNCRLKALNLTIDDIKNLSNESMEDLALFTATYEASSLRLFVRGRTETVRSLTNEMVDFICKATDKEVSIEEKIYLLKIAASKHQCMYREATTGKGCDRHLFALYVMSRILGKECHILKEMLSIPWELSTSQSPQQQATTKIDFDSPLLADKLSPGGGFGPVTPEGLGVAYMFPCNYKLFFHVTRFLNSKIANEQWESASDPRITCTSEQFTSEIFKALNTLKQILEKTQTKS